MHNRYVRFCTWGTLTLVLLVCSVAVFRSLYRNPEPAVLVSLPHSFKTPTRTRDQIESWLPLTPRWAWSHTVVDTLFGKRKPVNVNAETFIFDAPFDAETMQLGSPSFATDDGRLSVWFLTNAEIAALRTRLEAARARHESYRCRISTADGITASLFMGESVVVNGLTNSVGVTQSFLPLVNPTGTDLFTSACISAVLTNHSPAGNRILIQTNADFAARIQVPAQHGIFFLQHAPRPQPAKTTALMLDPL